MSRIRTIKPEFWTSEQVMECSPLARLAFIGMWNFCDDNGVHPASCKTLKAQVFPGDDITVADVQSLIDELIRQQLLAEFQADDHAWWLVTGWHHQLINRPSKSRYPLPPKMQKAVSTHGGLSEYSLTEGRGREGRGRERRGKEGKGEGEESARAETAPKDTPSAPALKGSRLSLEVLPQDWQAWAKRERPDLDPQRTFDTFHDYWVGKAGADGMKLDWSATWRNWVRREHAQTRSATPRNGTPQKLLTPEQDEWHQIIHGQHNTTCKIIEGEVIHEAH